MMKKLLLAVAFLTIFCSIALASWEDDFTINYTDKGIDWAVEKALEAGIVPDLIVQQALTLAEIDQLSLIIALHCASVNGQEVRQAAGANNVPEDDIVEGYKESVKVCRDAVAIGQGYPLQIVFPEVTGTDPTERGPPSEDESRL